MQSTRQWDKVLSKSELIREMLKLKGFKEVEADKLVRVSRDKDTFWYYRYPKKRIHRIGINPSEKTLKSPECEQLVRDVSYFAEIVVGGDNLDGGFFLFDRDPKWEIIWVERKEG